MGGITSQGTYMGNTAYDYCSSTISNMTLPAMIRLLPLIDYSNPTPKQVTHTLNKLVPIMQTINFDLILLF